MHRVTGIGRTHGLALAVACLAAAWGSAASAAEIVRFETVLGDIDVRLFEAATPASVANFLNYVNDGDYDDTFIHRAPPNFVVQGGGFNFPEGGGVGNVPTDSPVVNEPGLTNLRGTLAYAKLGDDPNSATSGWFFSTRDNSANLDAQNGGFTVFGRVIGDGLDVVDAIASQQLVNAGGAFTQLPVLDTFVSPNILRSDLVLINTVTRLTFTDGDYDFDGDVDLDDLGVWESQYGASLRIADHTGASLSTRMEADGNGDGVVDAADYTVWRDSFNAASVATAVPEPAGLVMALFGLSIAARRR